MTAHPYPLARERNLILVALVLLAASAWTLLIWQAATGDEAMGLTMGMGAPLFLAIWVTMMVAMMFPAAAPMILMFQRIHAGKRKSGQPFVPTWVFTGAYLVVWTAAGVLAYAIAVGAERAAERSMWLMDNAARMGGLVLLLAGIYQLSPLKRACLTKCRTPMSFILQAWRDGYAGSFRMGLEHGVYCLGCCWLLFAILFPLGVMNVAAMAVITVLIFAEKSLPFGRRIGEVAAVALIAWGALVLVFPAALPGMP
jgi:predicted metal-binding membrane protein